MHFLPLFFFSPCKSQPHNTPSHPTPTPSLPYSCPPPLPSLLSCCVKIYFICFLSLQCSFPCWARNSLRNRCHPRCPWRALPLEKPLLQTPPPPQGHWASPPPSPHSPLHAPSRLARPCLWSSETQSPRPLPRKTPRQSQRIFVGQQDQAFAVWAPCRKRNRYRFRSSSSPASPVSVGITRRFRGWEFAEIGLLVGGWWGREIRLWRPSFAPSALLCLSACRFQTWTKANAVPADYHVASEIQFSSIQFNLTLHLRHNFVYFTGLRGRVSGVVTAVHQRIPCPRRLPKGTLNINK